jgi:hypothetical protein
LKEKEKKNQDQNVEINLIISWLLCSQDIQQYQDVHLMMHNAMEFHYETNMKKK